MFINNLNPILFSWHFITIRYYGLFLAIGVVLSFFAIKKIFKKRNYPLTDLFDLFTYLIIGGLIGARLGHIIFYNLTYYLQNPLEIFFVNHGGLSSHGLAFGLIITLYLIKKYKKIQIEKYLDPISVSIPILACCIRLGNFFNSEIVGKTTNLPWGIKFPLYEKNPLIRHPSQIYESITAFLIFIFLYFLEKKAGNKLPRYYITFIFIILYFTSRFLIEFVKEYPVYPSFLPLTTGQWLSLPFIIISLTFFYQIKKNK